MNVRLRQRLMIYQYIAGMSDTCTGLLLIGFPVFTLSHMGLTVLPQPVAYARFIGVFVFSVGLTYLWTAIRWPLNKAAIQVWLTQWKISALVRGLVALFLIWQWMVHQVAAAWITVIAIDGLFAASQFIGLKQGWIERAV